MTTETAGPELATFARAILVAHQHDALDYLDLRVEQLRASGDAEDAAYWTAVRAEARRQVEAGEWHPRG